MEVLIRDCSKCREKILLNLDKTKLDECEYTKTVHIFSFFGFGTEWNWKPKKCGNNEQNEKYFQKHQTENWHKDELESES